MKKQLELSLKQTSTQPEYLVSPSQLQEEKKARKTLDTSGRTCTKLLSTKDPLMSLSKMLVASSMWHSIRSVLNWKVKATPQGRLYFQLQASMLPIEGTGCGVSPRGHWSTPTSFDSTNIKNYERKENSGGQKPPLSQEVMMYRTPTTMDAKGDALKHATKLLQGKTKRASGEQVQITLVDQVMMQEIINNPELMEEFKDHLIVTRPLLPPQDEFVDYLRSQTSVKELAEGTDIKKTTIEHWFRRDKSGFSHPSIEDWETIKPFLQDLKYDQELTTIEEAEWEQTKEASLWPTPRATSRMAYAEKPSPSMIKGTHGWNLNAAVTDAESDTPNRMWPTPRAAIGMHMKMSQGLSDLQHKRYLETEVAHEHIEVEKKQPGGHLNADWVEWLMGYGQGYTDLEDDTKQSLFDHDGFYDEPEIPRVTHNQADKVNRLKSLGNSIVPQIAYNLGLAIYEDYSNGK